MRSAWNCFAQELPRAIGRTDNCFLLLGLCRNSAPTFRCNISWAFHWPLLVLVSAERGIHVCLQNEEFTHHLLFQCHTLGPFWSWFSDQGKVRSHSFLQVPFGMPAFPRTVAISSLIPGALIGIMIHTIWKDHNKHGSLEFLCNSFSERLHESPSSFTLFAWRLFTALLIW